MNLKSGRIKGFGLSCDGIISFLFVLYAFVSMKPFFTWTTYHNGIFSGIMGASTEMLVALLLCIAGVGYFAIREARTDKMTLLLVASLLLLGTVMLGVCGGFLKNITNSAWLKFIVIALYLLMPDRIKVDVFEKFYFLFVATAIIPLIYFLLERIGIHLPYQELSSYEPIKVEKNFYYRHYLFAVQIANRFNPMIEVRLSGIYDEAGRLGTTAALFLCGNDFDLKKRINVLCLVIGACSFSLAFYLICFAFLFMKAVSAKKIKGIALMAILAIAYLIFINLHFENTILSMLQSRVQLTDEGLSGDNRTSSRYDLIMTSFNRSSVFNLLFGFGINSIGAIQERLSIDGSSYKSLIYNFGYVGFGMYMMWILSFGGIMIAKSRHYSDHIVRMMAVMLMNFYQRPTVLSFPYFLIYIGSIYCICVKPNTFSISPAIHMELVRNYKDKVASGLKLLSISKNAKG